MSVNSNVVTSHTYSVVEVLKTVLIVNWQR